MKATDDPRRYRAMSEPHATREDLNAAIDAFFTDIEASRVANKLANVFVIVRSPVTLSDGVTESDLGATLRLGDGNRMMELIAWAFGQQQALDKELVAAVMASGKDSAK